MLVCVPVCVPFLYACPWSVTPYLGFPCPVRSLARTHSVCVRCCAPIPLYLVALCASRVRPYGHGPSCRFVCAFMPACICAWVFPQGRTEPLCVSVCTCGCVCVCVCVCVGLFTGPDSRWRAQQNKQPKQLRTTQLREYTHTHTHTHTRTHDAYISFDACTRRCETTRVCSVLKPHEPVLRQPT